MGDSLDDMIAVQKHLKAERQARHARWKKQNTEIIKQSGIWYIASNNGEAFLFREQGKPKVDFYPSTGRWRVYSGRRPYPRESGTMRGGASAFLSWYRRQEIK